MTNNLLIVKYFHKEGVMLPIFVQRKIQENQQLPILWLYFLIGIPMFFTFYMQCSIRKLIYTYSDSLNKSAPYELWTDFINHICF